MRINSLAAVFAIAATATVCADEYALLVGVNECPNFRLADDSKPRALRAAESDAATVAEVLMERFRFSKDNVQILVGGQATYEAVHSAFAKLAQQLRPSDVFVFYFAGHGTQIPDRRPLFEEDDELDEALCLADCDAQGNNLLVDDELGGWLDTLEAGRVTVILDCCHAGTGTKDGDDEIAARYLPFPGIERATTPASTWKELKPSLKSSLGRRSAFFACAPQQQSYERRLPHQMAPARSGQFTYYLMQGLTSGKADLDHDAVVTNAEALQYARARLDATFNLGRKEVTTRQEPVVEADEAEAPIFLDTR